MSKDKDTKNQDAAEKKIAELEDKIAEVAKEKDDLFEQLQRISADYANYQKRVPKQISDTIAYEKKAIIRSILPSLDNFEHAMAAAAKAETVESVVEGIKITFDHLLDALKAHNVQKIVSVGQQFDPSVHEAMMRRQQEDREDNVILEEFQSGYMLGDQVLRPAKVIVNKLPDASAPSEPQAEEQPQESQHVQDNQADSKDQ